MNETEAAIRKGSLDPYAVQPGGRICKLCDKFIPEGARFPCAEGTSHPVINCPQPKLLGEHLRGLGSKEPQWEIPLSVKLARDEFDAATSKVATGRDKNPLIFDLPPEVKQYEHDIRRFVDAMIYKLKVHHRKGRWEDMNIVEAQRLLAIEVDELDGAIKDGNTVEVMMEGADVANFAMIIASIVVERGK